MSLQINWYKVEGTNIYTTGHLIIEESELMRLINSQVLKGDYKFRVKKKEYFKAKLRRSNKVSLQFFPIKSTGRILMEVNISTSQVNQIESKIPIELMRIIKGRKPVRYNSGDI